MAIVTTTRTPKTMRCPVCGGLECLCRPRFFAGQLLTEDDLNRLERYIIGKNKLHNRYLHGTGVVCGLEVSCHQCKGFVNVKSGYALSPCGDDIVLCDDQAVNVCELIQHCREQQFQCVPAFPPPRPICGNEDEKWILYVCYDERPSRGVTPLHGASGGACCSKCSCGGASACGCGGGTSTSSCGCSSSTKSDQLTHRYVPTKSLPQCEPTVLCEGFQFQLRKAPDESKPDFGEFVRRIQECVKLSTELQALVIGLTLPSQIEPVKAKFTTLANQHAIGDCGLLQRIAGISSTLPINEVKQQLILIAVEIFAACLCATLLPPCAPSAEENCVPLATLTLNCRDGCNVVRVCNVENRSMLVTMPTLKYYLEGFFKALRLGEVFRRLCCEDLTPRFTPGEPQLAAGQRTAVDNLINHLVQPGEVVNRKSIFQHLARIVQEVAASAVREEGR